MHSFPVPRILRVLGLLLLPGLLSVCETPQPATFDAQQYAGDEAVRPLVFIPGLMGSNLARADGDKAWLLARHGLGLSTPDLRLPLDWQQQSQQRDALQPAGIVMDVSLIPGLIGQAVYAPWADFASTIPNRPLYIFSYDWRRDNNETAARFEIFLDELKQQYNGRAAQVVAHSMGGMISLAVLNRRPELMERVVFVGVPFRGGVGYLDNMHRGTSIGANAGLLAPEVLFSHTSVYSFYPAGQAFENTDIVRDENGNDLRLDFYEPQTWQDHQFGVFAAESADWRGDVQQRLAFLKQALDRGREFRRAMRPRQPASAYPPVLVVGGKQHGTLAYTQRLAGACCRWDFDDTPREPGDGSVLYRDMLPPEPIAHKVTLSTYWHSYLLNDPAKQSDIAGFLLRADAE